MKLAYCFCVLLLGCANISPFQLPGRSVRLVVQPLEHGGKYSFFVYYSGNPPLAIREDRSLFFLVDDTTFSLEADGIPNEPDPTAITPTERAFYPTNLSLIEKIASAKSVVVRVNGRTHFVEDVLSDKNIAAFREFAATISRQHQNSRQ